MKLGDNKHTLRALRSMFIRGRWADLGAEYEILDIKANISSRVGASSTKKYERLARSIDESN